MGLKEKVWQTLTDYFSPDEMVINDDEAITGFLVSPRFKNGDSRPNGLGRYRFGYGQIYSS